MSASKPLSAEHGVIMVDGMYVGQTAKPDVADQLVQRFNAHDAMVRTLELLRVQLEHSWAPDPAMQEVMLADVNKTLALAAGSPVPTSGDRNGNI